MRADWRCLKALALSDAVDDETLVCWATAPLLRVEVPDEAHDPKFSVPAATSPGTDALPLPFERASFRVPARTSAGGEACLQCLVLMPDHEPADLHGVLESRHVGLPSDRQGRHTVTLVMIGCYEDARPSIKFGPAVVRVYLGDDQLLHKTVLMPRTHMMLPDGYLSEAIDAALRRLAMVLNTIYAAPARLVHSRGTQPSSAKQVKAARLKPWLREDLPDIQLMAGPPEAVMRRGALSEGRHAPRPHARRGHWRHLEDGRRVFIRPSWIGPRSWELEGRTYSMVVDPGLASSSGEGAA